MNALANVPTENLLHPLVLSRLAGAQWRLDVFLTHGKIYEALAVEMFGIPLERIVTGNPEYTLRQKAEIAELALCYQGSTGALIAMGALDMGLTEDELPDIVTRWREANRRICELWYAMESAAAKVIAEGGCMSVGACSYRVKSRATPEKSDMSGYQRLTKHDSAGGANAGIGRR